MKDVSRRAFCKLMTRSLGLYPLSVLGNLNLLASPLKDNNACFMMIRVHGGMDSLQGLNPWMDSTVPGVEDGFYVGPDYNVARIRGTELQLGPSAFSLARHAGDLSVINGVFMGTADIGHPTGMKYITSNSTSPMAPDLPALLAGWDLSHGINPLLGVVVNAPFQKGPFRDVRVSVPRDLKFDNYPSSFTVQNSMTQSRGGFSASLDGWRQLKAGGHIDRLENLLSAREQPEAEHFAAACMATGLSNYALIDWNYKDAIDNHFDYIKLHRRNQRVAWRRVAELIAYLKTVEHSATGKALFPNHLTLMVVTEFGRGPGLNHSEGKAHNFFENSVLLGGRGVKGGQVVGGAEFFPDYGERSRRTGGFWDFSRNEYLGSMAGQDPRELKDAGIDLIRPRNVIKTAAQIFGVDTQAFPYFDDDTPVIKKIIGG